MKIGRVEFGIARDSKGKIAPFELSYLRGACDCTILSVGWFYFTILRGECRDSSLLDWENSLVGNELDWTFEDIPKSTLEDWEWDENHEDKK